MKLQTIAGQSLIEILVALAVGAILIGAATGAITLTLRKSLEIRTTQVATALTEEYIDSLQAIAESNWHDIYDLPDKGPSSHFYLTASGTTYAISSGTTSTISENLSFTRYFSVENVSRASCGTGDITQSATTTCGGPGTNGVADDPSTQKITVTAAWAGGRLVQKVQNLTRYRNKIFIQTDWSLGAGQEGPITEANSRFATSTNVDYSTSTGSIRIQGL